MFAPKAGYGDQPIAPAVGDAVQGNSMAKPVVIVVGADKGGVGKTTVSRTLLDYFSANNVPTRAFDTESPRGTLKRLREHPRLLACDALLDQTLFAGSGNIIKNEVLYRIRVHPLSLIGELPPAKLRELVREARTYSFQFLEWKRAGVLKANWLAHGKNTCVRCRIPLVKAKELGRSRRRAFFCERCQKRYGDATQISPDQPSAVDEG